MPFDPTLPANGSPISSAEMRDQLNALDAQTKKIGPGGLLITGNLEVAATVGLVFLKSDGTTDSGYRLNYNDDTDGLVILRNGAAMLVIDGEGLRVYPPAALVAYGDVKLPGLPGADPHVTGQLWNNAGTLKISAG